MADREDRVVALCGLGNMGSALASRLARRFTVLGYDIDASQAERVAQEYGITRCAEPSDLAVASTLILCLPAPQISREVCAVVAPLMPPGSTIIETSTVNPSDMTALATFTDSYRLGLVDAAIAAGVAQMKAGKALLLVGGADDHVARVMPVLESIAESVKHLGPLGSGAALKVINNAVAHAVMVVLVEAAALAEASGVSRQDLVDLMTGNHAGLTRPLEHRLMQRIAAGDYSGGMPVQAAHKDSTLALALAQSTNVPIFAIHASHVVYELALAQGKGRLDYASIAQMWESWLGRPLTVGRAASSAREQA